MHTCVPKSSFLLGVMSMEYHSMHFDSLHIALVQWIDATRGSGVDHVRFCLMRVSLQKRQW